MALQQKVQMNFQNIPKELKGAIDEYKELTNHCSKGGSGSTTKICLRDMVMLIFWAELNKAAVHCRFSASALRNNYNTTELDKRVECPKFGLSCASCTHFDECTSESPMEYEPTRYEFPSLPA